MPLPAGQWNVNGNGFTGVLNISTVDGNGNLAATIYGDQVIGLWDDVSQRITFVRLPNPSDPSTAQVWNGYLFSNATLHTLAGSFEGFQGSGSIARRTTYGWFAQVTA
jgi:hypothetical protein